MTIDLDALAYCIKAPGMWQALDALGLMADLDALIEELRTLRRADGVRIDGLLRLLALHPDTPIELCYHPDADPGDGSGWSLLVGDRYTYGQAEDIVREAIARGGPA